MNIKSHLREAGILAPLLMLATILPTAAAEPTNVFAKFGIDVVHPPQELIDTLGSLASVYVSLMNGLVVLAMIFFAWVSAKLVYKALKASNEAEVANLSGGGEMPSSWGIVKQTIGGILESGAITVIALFVIIKGSELLFSAATGSLGLFVVDDNELLPKLMGPLGPVTAKVQSIAALGAILLGAAIAAWKALGILRADDFDHYSGHRNGDGQHFVRTTALVKELGAIALLTVLAYLIIRQGPNFVASLLSGVESVTPDLN